MHSNRPPLQSSALSPATVIVLLQLSTLASVLAVYWLCPLAMHSINEMLASLRDARGPDALTMLMVYVLYWLFGVLWTLPYWLAPVLAFLLPLLTIYPLLRRDPVGVHATLRQFVAPPVDAKAPIPANSTDGLDGRHASVVFFVSLVWPGMFFLLIQLIGKGPWLAFSGWWLLVCAALYWFVLVLLAILTMAALMQMAARHAAKV